MLNRFKNYIIEQQLFNKEDKILLTVSGGVDSLVMLDLFKSSGFNFGLAHCNFSLRGLESDNDEKLVQSICQKYHIPFYIKKFDTESYAKEKKISIQMAARELRYEWFDELRISHQYDYISIAHNKNDIVETFLVNLSRGTGIKGLTGIKAKKGRIIRPILFASREEIMNYSKQNNITYREDSSNSSTKYKRNKIRHDIIYDFESINPNFLNTIVENIHHLADVEKIYEQAIGLSKKSIVSKKDGNIYLSIEEFKKLTPPETYLFEILRPYNFSNQNIKDIILSLGSSPGKQFFSSSHRLVRDREFLIITPITEKKTSFFYIEEDTLALNIPIHLELNIEKRTTDFTINPNANIAYLDYSKLEFPLLLRKWNSGDYFRPLGMKEMKKLSDFFIDNKLSIPEKENTWILSSGNKICWIVGKRIDDRFKVIEDTSEILVVRWKK